MDLKRFVNKQSLLIAMLVGDGMGLIGMWSIGVRFLNIFLLTSFVILYYYAMKINATFVVYKLIGTFMSIFDFGTIGRIGVGIQAVPWLLIAIIALWYMTGYSVFDLKKKEIKKRS